MWVGEYKLHVSEKVRIDMNQTNDICESVVIRPSVVQKRVSETLEQDDGEFYWMVSIRPLWAPF